MQLLMIVVFRNKIDYKNEFNIYLNPVNDTLYLDSKAKMGDLTIRIFNIEGKLLDTQNSGFKNQIPIDVSSLSSGIYFLNIEDEKGSVSNKKFIKK